MHRLVAILRQVHRENKIVTFKTDFKDGQFTRSNGYRTPSARVTALHLGRVLDYAFITVASNDFEALGAERQRDVLAHVIASREIYVDRLHIRAPYLIDFPLNALFVEQNHGSGFTWVLISFAVEVKLSYQEHGFSPRGVEPYSRE